MLPSPSRRILALTWPLWLAACGRQPLDLSGGTTAPATTTMPSETSTSSAAGSVLCAGKRCGVNEICCVLDGTCILPSAAAAACPRPTAVASPTTPGATPCGSNADCAATEFCGSVATCLGPGECMDRANCGTSTGPSVCGCDGVTYPDVQTACRAGMSTLGRLGACGVVNQPGGGFSEGARQTVTFCGQDQQCSSGQQCCAIYGTCFDPSMPELCTFAPPGTRVPCLADVNCRDEEFCQGNGCSGPGGCVATATDACTGVLDPVCGCDGKTYTNEGCTVAAGVRTFHTGSCEVQ